MGASNARLNQAAEGWYGRSFETDMVVMESNGRSAHPRPLLGCGRPPAADVFLVAVLRRWNLKNHTSCSLPHGILPVHDPPAEILNSTSVEPFTVQQSRKSSDTLSMFQRVMSV
jgi:hypothetical protein